MKLCGYNEKCYVYNTFQYLIKCDNLIEKYSNIFLSGNPVCTCINTNEKVNVYNNDKEFNILMLELRNKKIDSL